MTKSDWQPESGSQVSRFARCHLTRNLGEAIAIKAMLEDLLDDARPSLYVEESEVIDGRARVVEVGETRDVERARWLVSLWCGKEACMDKVAVVLDACDDERPLETWGKTVGWLNVQLDPLSCRVRREL